MVVKGKFDHTKSRLWPFTLLGALRMAGEAHTRSKTSKSTMQLKDYPGRARSSPGRAPTGCEEVQNCISSFLFGKEASVCWVACAQGRIVYCSSKYTNIGRR